MRLLTGAFLLLLAHTASAVAPRWVLSHPESAVHPIITTIRYANGDEQTNTGTGFVVGERFYTAYHNIQAGPASVESRTISLGGVSVDPAVIDVAHDLAVFVLPGVLCTAWCNKGQLVEQPPESATNVMWVGREGKHQVWKAGRVSNLAFKSDPVDRDPSGCEDNLIVEIDHPFVPGSSGGPVFDASTGLVIGLIQGSFEHRTGKVTGYYKPVKCVLSRLETVSLITRYESTRSE